MRFKKKYKNGVLNNSKRMVAEHPWIIYDCRLYVIYLKHYCEHNKKVNIEDCSKCINYLI